MLRSIKTAGIIPVVLLSLHLIVIYLPVTKAIVGDYCVNNNCTGANETCTIETCLCADGFYDSNGNDTGGTCNQKLGLESSCNTMLTGDIVCNDSNAACTDGKCKCRSNYYDDNGSTAGGSCQLKLGLESSCNTMLTGDIVCNDSNAACTDGKCKCRSNYYDDNGSTAGGSCQLKLDLGTSCLSPFEGQYICKDSHAACTGGKCTCGSNYYDDNGATAGGNCQLMTNLQVIRISFGTITENSIQVFWTPSNNSAAVSYYRVEYKSEDNTSGTPYNVTNQMSVLNNLSPGKKYSISIFSINTQTDSTERSTSRTQNQTTKPAIPGALVADRDINASSGSISLQWQSSVGVVTGYGGFLENKTFGYYQTFNTTGITPSQTFSGMRSGTWYTFTAQAVIGYADTITLYSNISTQLIRTLTQVPNPPTNLTCVNSTDRAISLKWMQPQLSNGDIASYDIVIERTQPRQDPYYKTSQGPNVEYTAVGLTAGSFYTFKVFTRNENFTSTAYAEVMSCETKPTMADPPEGLNVTDVTSRSGIVNWSMPITLNSTNYGYSLQILNGSYCTREVIWRCSDCQGNFPNQNRTCSNTSERNVSSTTLNGSQSYKALDLLPDTIYTVTVAAITGNGIGYRASKDFTTNEEAPSKPFNVYVRNITNKTATVDWNIDGARPGRTNYIIIATGVSPAEMRTYSVSGFYERTYTIFDLEEYWNYSVTVQANTSIGSNQSDPFNFITLRGSAGKVNFTVDKGLGSDMYVKARVSWKLPEVLNQNGPINSFNVQQLENYGNGHISEVKQTIINRVSDDSYTYIVTFDVKPEADYRFKVRADTGNLMGEENVQNYLAPAGPPVNIETEGVDVIPADKASAFTKTSFRVEFNWAFFRNTKNGATKEFGLICCKDPSCKNNNSIVQSFNEAMKNMMTYAQAKKSGSNQYRLPNKNTTLEQVSGRRKRAVDNTTNVYDVGVGSCDGLSIDQYCNGQLDPGSTYRIIAFVCTSSWCTFSRSYGPFITVSEAGIQNSDTGSRSVDTPVIVGIVCGTFFLTTLVIAITVIILRKIHTTKRSADTNPGDTYMDLIVRTNESPYMSYKSPVYDSIPADR